MKRSPSTPILSRSQLFRHHSHSVSKAKLLSPSSLVVFLRPKPSYRHVQRQHPRTSPPAETFTPILVQPSVPGDKKGESWGTTAGPGKPPVSTHPTGKSQHQPQNNIVRLTLSPTLSTETSPLFFPSSSALTPRPSMTAPEAPTTACGEPRQTTSLTTSATLGGTTAPQIILQPVGAAGRVLM